MHIFSWKYCTSGFFQIVLNALDLRHAQYFLVLLPSVDHNLLLTLEKQLNWAIKAYLNQRKLKFSDLKIKYGVLAFSKLFEYRTEKTLKTVELPFKMMHRLFQGLIFIYMREQKLHLV